MTDPFSNADPGDPVQPCWTDPPRHWIEIVLEDDDGRRIAYAEYVVTTPSGETVRGYLDGEGFLRLGGMTAPGNCQVQFPGIDGDAWSHVSSGPSEQIG